VFLSEGEEGGAAVVNERTVDKPLQAGVVLVKLVQAVRNIDLVETKEEEERNRKRLFL
jgi:hypothetical protein